MSSSQQEGQVSKSDSQFSVDLKTNKIKKKSKKKKPKKMTPPKIITSTYRKQKCLHYNKGNCTKGELCTFSHDFQPQSSKIICRYFISNACSKGASCNFSHNTQDYPCKFFHLENRCSLNESCRFSHKPINKEYLNDFIKENKDYILHLFKENKMHLITDENLKREVAIFIPKEVAQEQPKKKGFKGQLKLLAQNSIQLADQTNKPKHVPVDPRIKLKMARQIKIEQNERNPNTGLYRNWITEVPQTSQQQIKLQPPVYEKILLEKFLYSYY